jgi:CHAT domain-containing protein
MAGSAKAPAAPAPAPPPVTRLTVVNGDLSFARYPVVVGHFLGDSIAGAEAQLDSALLGALTRRYALGIYPGALGSAMVVEPADPSATGAVVVGIGDIGSFSPGVIRSALIDGLLELALSPCWAAADHGVSLVMLGSRAGSVSSSDSLAAMLAAVGEVQRRLRGQGLKPLGEVQFLALYEDDAHRIWHPLNRFVHSPHYGESFTLGTEIVYASGAQRRLMRMEDPDLWRAIQIVSADVGGGELGFRFTAVGEQARADGYLVGTSRTFVKQFMKMAQQRKLEAAPTRALFQLIWPAELKQASQEDRNLRLILDEHAAALPFELMDDRPAPASGEADSGAHPPAVRRGMLRQLIQTRFARLQASPRGGDRALVIGDPRGGAPAADFAPLPGAREEAAAVADLLEEQGFEVVRLIGDEVTPDAVVEHVLQGGWTILHVSAHGIYDYAFRSDRADAKAAGWDGESAHYTGPRHTGIVLADRLTLAPSILQSMPDPPVLAFINCCELASIDPDDEMALRSAARPEFAASFAGELIALGARAVIAAGWEVSDQGALVFARSIYRELLANNQGFGDAVRIARGDVYDKDPDDATWGAYQCYGEPDWRLRVDAEAPARTWREPGFASPAEAVAAIEGIRNWAEVGVGRQDRRAGLVARLTAIHKYLLGRHWMGRGGVAEQLGHAYHALGESERALALFEEALKRDEAVSLRLVEMLANLRIRETACGQTGAEPSPDALECVAAARQQLVFLCETVGKSGGRLRMIGEAASREALLLRRADRDAALSQMREAFEQAWAFGARDGGDVYYPGLMAATAGVLIALRDGDDFAPCRALLEDLGKDLADPAMPGDYWRAAGLAGMHILTALVDKEMSAHKAGAIAAALRQAWAVSGSEVDREGALVHLRLLQAILSEKKATHPAADWVASIERAATLAAPYGAMIEVEPVASPAPAATPASPGTRRRVHRTPA